MNDKFFPILLLAAGVMLCTTCGTSSNAGTIEVPDWLGMCFAVLIIGITVVGLGLIAYMCVSETEWFEKLVSKLRLRK